MSKETFSDDANTCSGHNEKDPMNRGYYTDVWSDLKTPKDGNGRYQYTKLEGSKLGMLGYPKEGDFIYGSRVVSKKIATASKNGDGKITYSYENKPVLQDGVFQVRNGELIFVSENPVGERMSNGSGIERSRK